MNSSLQQNKKNIFKADLNKKPQLKVTIGGADMSDLPSKETIIDQKIEEAREKADADAKRILEEAQAKAQAIVEAANAQKDNIIESARQEGFEQGYAEGTEKAEQEISESLTSSKAILEAVEKERQECLEDETNRIYKVVCLIAKKLIKQDLRLNPEISQELISSALKNLEYKSEVNILINPEIARKINKLKDEIIDSCPGLEKISITASEAMEPGDLVLESNKERLDFRIDSQIDELIKEICK